MPDSALPVVWKGPAVDLRYRRTFLGAPVLQQRWLGMQGKTLVAEWRDVPVVVPEGEGSG